MTNDATQLTYKTRMSLPRRFAWPTMRTAPTTCVSQHAEKNEQREEPRHESPRAAETFQQTVRRQ